MRSRQQRQRCDLLQTSDFLTADGIAAPRTRGTSKNGPAGHTETKPQSYLVHQQNENACVEVATLLLFCESVVYCCSTAPRSLKRLSSPVAAFVTRKTSLPSERLPFPKFAPGSAHDVDCSQLFSQWWETTSEGDRRT